jgi:hypothetical protein
MPPPARATCAFLPHPPTPAALQLLQAAGLRATLPGFPGPDHGSLLQLGEMSQVETVSEENKNLMWVLLRQLRPGMDLSRVVLPTFVLEPRSFLNKLSDYYYHADLLSRCAQWEERCRHGGRKGRHTHKPGKPHQGEGTSIPGASWRQPRPPLCPSMGAPLVHSGQ